MKNRILNAYLLVFSMMTTTLSGAAADGDSSKSDTTSQKAGLTYELALLNASLHFMNGILLTDPEPTSKILCLLKKNRKWLRIPWPVIETGADVLGYAACELGEEANRDAAIAEAEYNYDRCIEQVEQQRRDGTISIDESYQREVACAATRVAQIEAAEAVFDTETRFCRWQTIIDLLDPSGVVDLCLVDPMFNPNTCLIYDLVPLWPGNPHWIPPAPRWDGIWWDYMIELRRRGLLGVYPGMPGSLDTDTWENIRRNVESCLAPDFKPGIYPTPTTIPHWYED